MKAYLLTALFTMTAMLCQAQTAAVSARAVGVFKEPDGKLKPKEIWIIAATETAIGYLTDPGAANIEQARMADVDSLFVFEPKEYLDALDLYNGRKYEEAKVEFAKIAKKYERIAPIPNNFGVLSGFYEMECMRKLGDLDGLRKALLTFNKKPLTMKVPQQQLEVYVLWDAIRAKTFDKAEELARELEAKKLSTKQRAQVAYCLGLALEGSDKPSGDALLAYQTALVADAAASEEIVDKAALRILAILDADEQVKVAIKAYDASEGEDLIQGYTKVIEAAGVAVLYELHLGGGKPLPLQYRYFLKYKLKTAEEEEGKKDDKKEDDKKEAKDEK